MAPLKPGVQLRDNHPREVVEAGGGLDLLKKVDQAHLWRYDES
jgi:hypothetical protein